MNAVLERTRAATPHSQTHEKAAAFGPAIVAQPTSPKEIIGILRDKRRFPSPVRPLGSGSSVTRCVTANGGTVMDLSAMNRVIKIGDDQVTVQPGITLPELADHLRQSGLELKCGFELTNRTVGGAVCGAGLEATISGGVSQLAAHVVQVKAISADGKRFVVGRDDKNMLGMMRLSYGLLGIVYEITLKVRPISGFVCETTALSFQDLAQLDAKLQSATAGVKLSLLPFRDRVFMEIRRPASDADPGNDLSWKVRNWTLQRALPAVAKSAARAVPYRPVRYPLVDKISERTQVWISANRKTACGSNAIEQSGRMLGQDRFNHCTWAFRAANFTQAALAYRDFSREYQARTGFRCDMPTIALRAQRDRSAYLSPSFDGPVFTLSPVSTQEEGWDDFMFDFAEFAADHDGIPLFNQTTNATYEQAQKGYGKRLELFANTRASADRNNRLLNQFFAAYMLGS